MNLTQLKYFQAVANYSTVSEAAEVLHISQPSLSIAIKELEREFGAELFKRQYRGMVLTSAGETLLKMSADILSRAEHVEKVMKDMGNGRKTLRLGVPPMIGSLILPELYRGFHVEYPEVLLDITEGGREELMEKLSGDYIDMAFMPHSRPVEGDYVSEPVSGYEIVCCVSEDNPLAKKRTVTPSELEGLPVVLFKNSYFQTGEIKKWFEAGNVKPDILLQTGQLSTVLSLVRSNVAAGFMFRQLIDSNPDLVALPAKYPIYASVSLVWKRNGYFTDSMKKFLRYIK